MPSKKKLVMPSQNPRFNLGPDRPGQIFFAFSKNAREHLTQQERHLGEGFLRGFLMGFMTNFTTNFTSNFTSNFTTNFTTPKCEIRT